MSTTADCGDSSACEEVCTCLIVLLNNCFSKQAWNLSMETLLHCLRLQHYFPLSVCTYQSSSLGKQKGGLQDLRTRSRSMVTLTETATENTKAVPFKVIFQPGGTPSSNLQANATAGG